MMTKKPTKTTQKPPKAKAKPVTPAKPNRARKPSTKPRPPRRIDPDKNQQGQGGGRPMKVFDSKMTSEVERLAAMLTIAQMGDYFGCGETTMHEVFKRQPEVSEAYHRGRAKITGAIAQNLIQKAMAGDYQSQSLYLRTQAGWSETTKLDHTSSDKSMSPREMTDEELELELAKYGITRDQ